MIREREREGGGRGRGGREVKLPRYIITGVHQNIWGLNQVIGDWLTDLLLPTIHRGKSHIWFIVLCCLISQCHHLDCTTYKWKSKCGTHTVKAPYSYSSSHLQIITILAVCYGLNLNSAFFSKQAVHCQPPLPSRKDLYTGNLLPAL